MIWTGVMALLRTPIGDGREPMVTTGADVGTMVNVMTKSLLLFTGFVARTVVATIPLAVGVPLMTPELVLRLRPMGNGLTSE